MQVDLEKGGRPIVKIPAVFAIDRGRRSRETSEESDIPRACDRYQGQ
jgi:hypothetical protein